MGCTCSKAVAAATQDEIDRLTSKQARRQSKRKQHQKKADVLSTDVPYIPAAKLDTVDEARVSPPRSEASAKHSQDAEVARDDRETAPSARSAGSDKSAPSVAQRASPGQGRKHRKRSHAGSVASGMAASEFTQDGASTFAPSHGTGEDDSSDWDRFSDDGNETTSSTALSDGIGPASQGGQDNAIKRPREHSLFGVAEKRAPAPFRETTSLNLAKLRGVTFVNQYVVIKYLGKGANGRVFLCLDMCDNRLYAVKIVKKVDMESSRGRKKRNPLNDLRREVAIMRTLRHKNIVALQEVVDDPGGNKMLLVMDYMEGGPVLTREGLERGRCIPEPLALQYFRDMCKALDYLHFNKVVHGDLKPENVLMSARGQVTLSDFGCSKVLGSGNEYLEKCQGTPAFLAPEMMRPHSRYRGRPTDIYALGACLFTFVYGRIPFSAPTVYQLFQVVQTEPLRFPEEPLVSDDLKDLLTQMLIKNPRERITLSKVMRHPWVTKRGAWPLLTVREMGGCLEADDDMSELNPQLMNLPDLMATSNVLDIPRQDHLLEVLKPGLAERAFSDGEYLIRQGDQGTHLLYIVEGAAEVLLKLSNPRITEHHRTSSSGLGVRGSHDSDGLQAASQVPEVIGDELPPTLLEGASRSRSVISGLQRGHREFLVAVRREGQFVGEMAAFASAALRCASVRARGLVRARIVPGELLRACVERVPEARQQLKEMVWMKSSENMVLEAMFRLSGLHDALEELLRTPIVPHGPSREEKGKGIMQPQHTAVMVEPDEAASSSSASTLHGRPYRPPSGHRAVYHSPTPSVPMLPLTPAVQPTPARSMVDAHISEAPERLQTASAPVTRRESREAVQCHAASGSQDIGIETAVSASVGAQTSPEPETLPAPSAAFMMCRAPTITFMQDARGVPAARLQDQLQLHEQAMLRLRPSQDQTPIPSMERQGSCPVKGSSPTSIASGPMSARSHISINGLPAEQPDQAQDTAVIGEKVTGALATPRDAAEEDAAAKNRSLIGPLRTMACPLPSSKQTAFEGHAQARLGLFNTEGHANLRRKLQHYPLRSSFIAALPKPAGAGSPARSETAARDRACSDAGEVAPRGANGAVTAESETVQAPVQTRFSVMEAVPQARVGHHAESAQAADEAHIQT